MDAKNISKERDKIDKFVNLRLLTLKCEAFVVVTGMLEEDEGSCPGGRRVCTGWLGSNEEQLAKKKLQLLRHVSIRLPSCCSTQNGKSRTG